MPICEECQEVYEEDSLDCITCPCSVCVYRKLLSCPGHKPFKEIDLQTGDICRAAAHCYNQKISFSRIFTMPKEEKITVPNKEVSSLDLDGVVMHPKRLEKLRSRLDEDNPDVMLVVIGIPVYTDEAMPENMAIYVDKDKKPVIVIKWEE